MKAARSIFLGGVWLVVTTGLLGAHTQAGDCERLRSPDAKIRTEAMQRILALRNETIQGLLHIVDEKVQSPYPDGAMVKAIKILGDFHAEEAIDTLIAHIAYAPPTVVDSDVEKIPPCVEALVKIGKAAADRCVDQLGKADVDNEQLLTVVEGVYGRSLAVQVLLDKETKAKETSARTRLQAARARLESKQSK
jgi:hypothetical protein